MCIKFYRFYFLSIQICGCSKNVYVYVECGLVNLGWPQEEMRSKARKNKLMNTMLHSYPIPPGVTGQSTAVVRR